MYNIYVKIRKGFFNFGGCWELNELFIQFSLGEMDI